MMATKEEIKEIERELADQSHRIAFAEAPERKCRRAVNPAHNYVGKIKNIQKYEKSKTNRASSERTACP